MNMIDRIEELVWLIRLYPMFDHLEFEGPGGGAGRVSEVIARFTLDALPGKQMAIDADLNAGVIDQETAKQRRAQVAQESDFFGSMDGASKFVRGDARKGWGRVRL